jgi:hypothetical protein
MKIICVDNFNREGPGYDDKLIAGSITEPTLGKSIVDFLNATYGSGEDNPYFFKLVEDDYKLQVFEP